MKSFDSLTVEYPLSNGGFVLVDVADLPLLEGRTWARVRATNRLFYAACSRAKSYTPQRLYMHRFLLGVWESSRPIVDHIDRNGLNNTRANIRLATVAQNNQNKTIRSPTGFLGVFQQHRAYTAKLAGSYLGAFQHAHEAAMAYDQAAMRKYGPHARLNFVAANDA